MLGDNWCPHLMISAAVVFVYTPVSSCVWEVPDSKIRLQFLKGGKSRNHLAEGDSKQNLRRLVCVCVLHVEPDGST